MKRLLWRRAVVLALVAGTVAAVGATVSSGSNRETAAPSSYAFGGTFTLTGPAAFLGLFEEAAVRLAVEQFMKGDCIIFTVPRQPCRGGGLLIGGKKVPIRWKAYDDQSDARKAIDNVTRLLEQDKARAIWGPRMNDAVVSSASILEPRKIINICSICSSPAMTIGRKYGFDITDTGVLEKHAIGQFINEPDRVLRRNGVNPSFLRGRKRTAFIGRNELYTVHGSYGWEEAMEKGGRKFQFDRKKDTILYPFGTTDFSSYVAKLAARKPQIVLMDAYVIPDMISIMKEMKKQGLNFENGKIVLLGNDVFALQFFHDTAKKEGLKMSNQWNWGWQEHKPDVDKTTQARIDKYVRIYNKKFAKTNVGASSPFDQGTYDAAMWLLYGIEKAGTLTDNDKIAAAMKSLRLNGLRFPGEQMFRRPDNGEMTGQLYVKEHIMGFKNDKVYYTGINYQRSLFYGPWVYGDKLPKG
jgi:ABC-type branched-subunit amino acid transport system substrate-binding protein